MKYRHMFHAEENKERKQKKETINDNYNMNFPDLE